MHRNWDHSDTPASQFPAYEGVPSPNDMPPRDAAGMSAFSATSAKKKLGTTVSFRLDRAATVVFTVQRAAAGRKVKRGKKTTCDRPTRSNRNKKKCTRFAAVNGSFSRSGIAGKQKFHFTGRLRGKKLTPGSYKLIGTPITAGKPGTAVIATFRIVS